MPEYIHSKYPAVSGGYNVLVTFSSIMNSISFSVFNPYSISFN